MLWLLANSAIICSCAALAWRYYQGPKSHWALPWILSGTFAPIYQLLGLGQITAWVLLGIVGFVVAERQRRDWLAGLALGLMTIKPHLAYLIWPAVFLWVWKEHRWRVAGGACTAFILLSALPLLINRNIYAYYLQLTVQHPLTEALDPSLSTVLRLLLGPDRWWSRVAAGCSRIGVVSHTLGEDEESLGLEPASGRIGGGFDAHCSAHFRLRSNSADSAADADGCHGRKRGLACQCMFAAGAYALVDGVAVLFTVTVAGSVPTAPGWTILYALLVRRLLPRLTKHRPTGVQAPSEGAERAILAE